MSRTSPAPPAPARRALCRLLPLCATLVLTSGCAILSPPPPRSGGDGLTVAAKETRKAPERQKPVSEGYVREPVYAPASYVVVEQPACPQQDLAEPPAPPGPHRNPLQGWRLGLVTGGTVIGHSPLQPSGEFGIGIGGEPAPGTSVDLDLLASPQRFAGTSVFAGAFDQPIELAADLSVRHMLTRDGRPLGIAPVLGLRFGSLFWDYRNGLLVDDGYGVRTVADDYLNSYSPYVGLAATLVDSPRMRLGAVVKTGVRFHDSHTVEGLRNDGFPTSGFVQLQLETRFPF